MQKVCCCSLVFCLAVLSAASAGAGTLEIKPAVNLTFPATPGQAYQLESSGDLAVWSAMGGPFLGQTGVVSQLAAADSSNRYFRVSSVPIQDLAGLLEPIRASNKVPAVACAVILSNRIVALGAVGLRKAGITNAPVTLPDKWHHGSLTKSMTATLAAMLVQEGRISWTTTLAEVFPAFASKMHSQWRGVTLEWLCSNRSGATGDLGPSGISTKIWNFTGTPLDGRRLLLESLTVLAPKTTPGTTYEYSNAGFAIAGHMLETVAGTPWEDLMTQRLFAPLGMTSAGFGVPATPRYIDHPWGHQLSGGNPLPIEPGPTSDNPPAIAPAGMVHCSLVDLANYVRFHVEGHRQGHPLLTRESFTKLHTAVPNNANYAYGWNAVDRSWAQGLALNHAGSNTQWYSVIWMAPNIEFGVVALCNLATSSGANPGQVATDQIVTKIIQTFL